jgi:hypothetical protein
MRKLLKRFTLLSPGNAQRDNRKAMQYLVPSWSFDPKPPCLVEERR